MFVSIKGITSVNRHTTLMKNGEGLVTLRFEDESFNVISITMTAVQYTDMVQHGKSE